MERAPRSEATETADPQPTRVRRTWPIGPRGDDVRRVRVELGAFLSESGLRLRVTNAALDVANELLVNAQRHAGPPIELVVEVGVADVVIRVHDGSAAPARVLPYRPGVSEHGLGLQLVRHLARDWGQDVTAEGKSVWALVG